MKGIDALWTPRNFGFPQAAAKPRGTDLHMMLWMLWRSLCALRALLHHCWRRHSLEQGGGEDYLLDGMMAVCFEERGTQV